jgi:hypothetical protein
MKVLKMYVSPDEKETLKQSARGAHCSLSTYCRYKALGKKLLEENENEMVRALIISSANIGKLIGMLKIYLREPKQDLFEREELKKLILSLQEEQKMVQNTVRSMLRGCG